MRRTPVTLLVLMAALWGSEPADAASRSVPGRLAHLHAAGQLDAASAASYLKIYTSSRRTLRHLSGTRHAELAAVLATVRRFASDNRLTPSRLPATFLTLRRNRDWWASHPLPTSGQRERFAPSELVWQYYPGQGMQIQWLGTFGRANALWHEGGHDAELGRLLDEATSLATQRASGIAFEYLFTFNGGRPPWVSGLAQGTGLTAFARGAARLKRPALLDVAHRALGIFRTPPPSGVRVRTAAGAHYLQYSYASSLHIVNGFTQSLNGLFDLGTLGHDEDAAELFGQGERQLRVELPTFDTGAWSLYSRGSSSALESNLGYHVLLRDFLRALCDRLTTAKAPSPQTTGTSEGGTVARTAAATTADPMPSPDLYCATASRFTADLHAPPKVVLSEDTWRVGRSDQVRFTLSKISTLRVTVSHAGKVVLDRTLTLGYGHRALDVRPRSAGPHVVRVRAVDLAGNARVTQETVHVRPAPKRHRRGADRAAG